MLTPAFGHFLHSRAVVVLWGLLTATSLVFLARYSSTAGPDGMPPPRQDAQLPLVADDTHHLLVMAIHPKCPCSRASLGELTRLLVGRGPRVHCAVLVYRPAHSEPDWIETGIVAMARQIPGIRMIEDVGGAFAKHLGMLTSGATVLYSPSGDVEFHGGVTAARGHQGDNLGSDAIQSILDGKTPVRRITPVFGCPIHWPQEDTRVVR